MKVYCSIVVTGHLLSLATAFVSLVSGLLLLLTC